MSASRYLDKYISQLMSEQIRVNIVHRICGPSMCLLEKVSTFIRELGHVDLFEISRVPGEAKKSVPSLAPGTMAFMWRGSKHVAHDQTERNAKETSRL